MDVDGVAFVAAGDIWLRGDGVMLFRVPDDMLRSTDPNGIGFDAERTNGNNGFISNGVCKSQKGMHQSEFRPVDRERERGRKQTVL